MSLTTLANLKVDLGISGSTEDARLTSLLRQAVAVVRAECQQYFGGVISANTLANPTVCTAIGHGLTTGQTIVISNSNSTPVINGANVVTVLTRDTFSIPVNVTTAGTLGDYVVRHTEYYPGNGQRDLVLKQRPVQSIVSVYEDAGANWGEADGAFAAGTLLTAGSNYALKRDGTGGIVSASGILQRVGGVWPATHRRTAALLVANLVEGGGSLRVTYDAGYLPVPADIVGAVHQLAGDLRMSAATGPFQSESLDGYSYSRLSASEQSAAISSVKSILKKYKQFVL